MGDDRPYALGRAQLVELPVHWSLDDAPYFAASPGTTALVRGLAARARARRGARGGRSR